MSVELAVILVAAGVWLGAAVGHRRAVRRRARADLAAAAAKVVELTVAAKGGSWPSLIRIAIVVGAVLGVAG